VEVEEVMVDVEKCHLCHSSLPGLSSEFQIVFSLVKLKVVADNQLRMSKLFLAKMAAEV
jgi:hypothetical protein